MELTGMIPLFKPKYNKEPILKDLADLFDSGWTGLGKKTQEFEAALARYVGSPYSVFVNSCTAALHLAVHCLGLDQSAKVLVPDITFVSTAACVQYCGLEPVLAPLDPRSVCLDLEAVERLAAADRRIKAVIPVHYGGNCCDLNRLVDICERYGLKMVEDCAHALGTTFAGRHVGTFGEFGCFSYHAVKNLPIADGGSVVAREGYKSALERLRWMGIDRSTFERHSASKYSFLYDIGEVGWKYHGNDLMAVIALRNLEILDQCNARRKQIYERYVEHLPQLEILRPHPQVRSSHLLVSCCIDDRDDFIGFMNSQGVSVGVHYRPLSHFSVFRPFAAEAVAASSNRLFRRLATLPCYPDLTEDEQGYVIGRIRAFLERKPATLKG
jgi:perosamine synthetase